MINIDELALKLAGERKTIKNELIRGAVQNVTKSIDKQTNLMSYSIGKSEKYRKLINRNKQRELIKINKYKNLREFILSNNKQSLKSIAGRSKLKIYLLQFLIKLFITMLIIKKFLK